MNVRPTHYLDAAIERHDDAWTLYTQGRHTAALYMAGVAIECLLHAFRSRSGLRFSARHDLPSLAAESGIYDFVTERQRAILRQNIAAVAARWKNNYRYVSEARLLAEFKRKRAEFSPKEVSVKGQSLAALNTGRSILAQGVEAWHRSTQ